MEDMHNKELGMTYGEAKDKIDREIAFLGSKQASKLRDKPKLRDKAVDAKRDADKRAAGKRKKAKRKHPSVFAGLNASLMSSASELTLDVRA